MWYVSLHGCVTPLVFSPATYSPYFAIGGTKFYWHFAISSTKDAYVGIRWEIWANISCFCCIICVRQWLETHFRWLAFGGSCAICLELPLGAQIITGSWKQLPKASHVDVRPSFSDNEESRQLCFALCSLHLLWVGSFETIVLVGCLWTEAANALAPVVVELGAD